MAHTPFPLLLLLLLGACAEPSGYPSLEPRPIERSAAESDVPAPPAAAAADPARDGRAAALAEQAAQGDAAFAKVVAQSCKALSGGLRAGEGSEAWIAAQQALSAIDAARAPVQAAAAELDQLLIDSSNAAPAIDTSRLAAAAAQVDAIDAAEQARAASLSAGKGC
jgi:hypothetical protein